MKTCQLAAVAICAMALGGTGATLEIVKVQQRYPWNGLVDIDYRVGLGEGEVLSPGNADVLRFEMTDNSTTPATVYRPITFLQPPPFSLTAGDHRVTWNATADGVTIKSDHVSFSARIVHHAPVYMVIDVSGGPDTNCYPVVYLDGAPADKFKADEYKTSKIVLRRIHPDAYVAGSDSTIKTINTKKFPRHTVVLTNAFYIGIYEITQGQYAKVTGKTPSLAKGDLADFRPVENVTWSDVRGGAWPTGGRAPRAESFIGILRARCKKADENGDYVLPVEGIDLPTEFRWEYACRSGTTTDRYSTSPLGELGRYSGNRADNRGGISNGHTVVGLYEPNAWGLYDMYGNVWEWCLDWYAADDVRPLNQTVEPIGADSGTERLIRGASWDDANNCWSPARSKYGKATNDIGFRLTCVEQ